MNRDGGGDINPTFERVQAWMLCLVMKLNLDKLTWVKNGSLWNPGEKTVAAMKRAFTNASMCRVETNTNIEQELIHNKSFKALLKSNPDPITKDACT